MQLNIYDGEDVVKRIELSRTIDEVRSKYGRKSIYRCVFLDKEISPNLGGTNDNKHRIDGNRA